MKLKTTKLFHLLLTAIAGMILTTIVILIWEVGPVLAEDQPDGTTIISPQTTNGVWGPGVITVASNVVINPGVVITVAPGTTIVIDGNYSITINGDLHTDGPVTFTASSATPGFWQGITYAPGSSGYLNQTTIEYATHALILNTTNPFTISNSTLRYNRHLTSAANDDAYGAGLVIMAGNHLIDHTDIYSNSVRATGTGAEAYGGGVDIRAGASGILNSRIYSNSATSTLSNGGGSGIAIRAGSSPLIQASEVTTNTLVTQANLANGGGIGIYGTTQAVIRNNWIVANQSVPTGGYGGGGGIGFESGARAALIDGNVIADNLSMGPGHSEGGGIDCWGNNVVTVTNNLLYNNRSRTIGGGMNINANAGAGNVNVFNNTVIGNRSATGGGLYLQVQGVAVNNIVVNNSADTANGGGGIYRSTGTYIGGPFDYNDVWGNTANGVSNNYVNVIAPDTNLSVDPLFLNTGNLVQQYHLQACSPVIDAGINSGAGLPSQDYDGHARPQFGGWDIGFDEVIPGPYLCKTVVPTNTVAPGQVVTYTLRFGNSGAAIASNALITDIVPISLTGVNYVNTGAAITPVPGYTYAWQTQDLAQNDSGVITITARVGLDLFRQTFTNTTELVSNAGGNSAAVSTSVCTTIQCMIDAANPGETVVVPAGVYTESLVLSKAVSVTGVSSATVIVRAPANQRVMLITGTQVTSDVIIASMTFTGGNTTASGGGVYVTNGAQPRFEDMTIINNIARYRGGGIYMDSVGATLLVSRSIITGNQVIYNNDANTRGAGIAVRGAGSALHISDSTITNNTAERYGGAIAIEGDTGVATLIVAHSDISGNIASELDGGAIYANLAVITITHSMLDNNRAPAGDRMGGAIYLLGNSSSLAIDNSIFSNNLGLRQGGAIYANGNDIKINISNDSLLTGNSTTDNDNNAFGGAIYLFGNRAELTITNSAVSTNTSVNYGGAIYIDGNSDTGQARLTITSSQINNNQATVFNGGGIWADQTIVSIANSTFNNNRSPNAVADRFGGAVYLTGNGVNLTVMTSTLTANTASASGGGIYVSNGTAQVIVANSVISANTTTRDVTANTGGGGLHLNGASANLTISDSTFANNTSQRVGGGLYFYGAPTARMTVSNSLFTDNQAVTNSGGGLYVRQSPTTMHDTTIRGNTATALNADGGGVYFEGASATLNNTQILSNTANDEGGGIYNSGATLNLTNSNIANNATGDDGGGIFRTAGTLTIENSTLSENSTTSDADGDGGALYFNGTTATINNTSIISNTANDDGGGICRGANGNINLNQTALAHNTAADDGGALYMAGGALTVANSTFSANRTLNAGGDGGALYVNNNANIYNATIFNNTAAGAGGGIRVAAGTVVFQNSIVTSNSTNNCNGTLSATGLANLADDATCGTSFTNNPNSTLLGPLADNGGPTWTHLLLPGNPAINSGNTATCTAAPVNGVDQRGQSRPQPAGGNCDIGAVEILPATLAVTKSASRSGEAWVTPGETVTYTIVLSNDGDIPNTNVTISDTFPAQTGFIPASFAIEPPAAGGNLGTQPILAENVTVAGGSLVTVTYAVNVTNPWAGEAVITNTAAVTSVEVTTPAQSAVTTMVRTTPELGVAKTGPTSAGLGETVVFTFTLTNTGNSLFRRANIEVVDDYAGPAVYAGGDDNGDNWLDLTETWLYTASYTIPLDGLTWLTNTVTVTATDSAGAPATATASHTTAIQNPPTANDASYTIDEDTELHDQLNATDPNGDPLTYGVAAYPDSGTVVISDTAVGSFVYTPTLNFNGVVSFTYTVTDPTNLTDMATVTITVTPVNDAPTLDPLADLEINEDAGLQTVDLSGIGSGADNEDQLLTIAALSGNPTLIPNPTVAYTSPDPTGSLSFTPATDQNGTAVISVTVTDGQSQNGVATRTFTVTVNPVNDAPHFTPGGDVTVNEDSGLYNNQWATAIRPGPVTATDENGQSVTFNFTGNSNPGLFILGPTLDSTGVLTFTPAANANGNALITVELQDDGGTANGGIDVTPPQEFTITVAAINDPPEWTVPGSQTAGQETDLVIPGISLADVDAGGNELVVNLAALSGTLTLNETANLTFGPGDGQADHTMTFTGTLAALNAALDNLIYRGDPGFTGLDIINLAANDQGFTGADGPESATAAIYVNVAAAANLSIGKQVEPTPLIPGLLVTYTIVVSNAGPAAVNGAIVTDTLPAQLLDPTWGCTASGGATCTASGAGNINQTVNLPKDSLLTYIVTGTLASSTTTDVVNSAGVTMTGVAELDDYDNTTSLISAIDRQADLLIAKSSQRDNRTGLITYTVTVQNLGPSDAGGTLVSDPIPAGIDTFTWQCTASGGASCTASGSGALNDTLADFPAGGQVVYTITATLTDPQADIVNIATLTPPPGVTNLAPDNSATDTSTGISPLYLPLIVKNFVPAPDLVVVPGSLVATSSGVTVTIQNVGTAPVVDAFWVDVYFNPSTTPTVNQPWDTIASEGVVWGITTDIVAGAMLTLSTNDPTYFFPQYSSPLPLPAGASVYALVDSINFATSYGAVQESNERNNLSEEVISSAGAAMPLTGQSRSPTTTGLPAR